MEMSRTAKRWMEYWTRGRYEFGKCNCKECETHDGKIDSENTPSKNLRIALKEIYGDDFVPGAFDPRRNFISRDCEARNLKGGSKEQYALVFQMCMVRRNMNEEVDASFTVCNDCGRKHDPAESVQLTEDRVVCDSCFRQYYHTCDICGEIRNRNRATRYSKSQKKDKWTSSRSHRKEDEGWMCEHCYNDKFKACAGCSMPVDKDHWNNVSLPMGYTGDVQRVDVMVSKDPVLYDYDTCHFSYTKNSFRRTIETPYRVMCNTCTKKMIIPCPRCGNDAYKHNMEEVHWNGDPTWLCSHCAADLVIIKRYDYTCAPKFSVVKGERETPNCLYYGTEVEMEYPVEYGSDRNGDRIAINTSSKEAAAEELLDWWGNDEIYLKADGSLENGFEVVTHPFTWSHYLKNRDKWSDFLLYAQTVGLTAPQSTGLHIHMSKDAFTYLHLYKFVDFFYKTTTRSLMLGIAERSNNRFARFDKNDRENLVKVSKDKKNSSCNRYSAINLMGGLEEEGYGNHPAKTVEARIFKGTLEPYSFHKNFEFLQSLYEFAACHTPKEMRVKKYLQYLISKKNSFRFITDFIKTNRNLNHSYNCIRPMMRGV